MATRKVNARKPATPRKPTTAKKTAASRTPSKPHDVGAKSDTAKAKPAFKPEGKLGGKLLSALWGGANFESGMITGPILDPSKWKIGKQVNVVDLTKYFGSKTVVTWHGRDKGRMAIDGSKIKYNSQGLSFLQSRADGSGDIATPPAMIAAMQTALKTGKAPKGSGLESIKFVPIK